jgi:asparagine synthase (glutamine-hydrolysing)
MCGIAGLIDFSAKLAQEPLAQIGRAMTGALRHRGPDDHGVWADAEAGVMLAHTRLSVVDLSPAGAQPMASVDGRWVILYNGEVYETEALKRDVEAAGHAFRGHSDTEIILESIARFGLDATLPRLVGMFAFALWDRQRRVLSLARDRVGIKPLYWGRAGGGYVFASELKALHHYPAFRPAIDQGALAAYFRFGYVPAPRSIFAGIAKVAPGRVVEISANGEPTHRAFWSARAVAAQGAAHPLNLSDDEATEQLDELLRRAVRSRMIADVPLGAFLSGGIDSSTVVAMMQAQSARPVATFSIGFREQGFDEAADAKRVAAHLGTEHREFYVGPADALAVVPKLAEMYDEPFADSSQIPTHLVSALARKHVTVALSGDGGDEVFGGYQRYAWADRIWRGAKPFPVSLRRGLARALQMIKPDHWNRLAELAPRGFLPAHLGDKVRKVSEILPLGSDADVYRRLVSQWEDPGALLPGVAEPEGILADATLANDVGGFVERMQLLDTLTYLPDDILTKVDRASMAVSLEARVPLLDHRLIGFAFALPRRFRVRGATSKWLLRRVLHRYVPAHLVERPKQGFAMPVGQWLKGDLRDWAEDLLSPASLAATGIGGADLVRERWAEHVSGRRHWEAQLWVILQYQAWHRRWMGG